MSKVFWWLWYVFILALMVFDIALSIENDLLRAMLEGMRQH